MKKDFKKSLFLLFFIGLLLCQTALQAQQKELKVLFVGNSYTYGNNLSHIMGALERGPRIENQRDHQGGRL